MTFDKKGKHNISSRDYAYAKKLISEIPVTIETKQKMKENHADVGGEKNPMFEKSVYDVWVEKYGIKEADKRKEKANIKRKQTWELKHISK